MIRRRYMQLLVIILVLYMLYMVLSNGITSNNTEGFDTEQPMPAIVPGIEEGQQRFNKFMNIVNISKPAISLDGSSKTALDVLGTPLYNKSGSSGNFEKSGIHTYKTMKTVPANLALAQKCEKIKTATCDVFGDQWFSQNCGVSFDKEGLDSAGKPHMGGMFVLDKDRLSQSPTIGVSKEGAFAIDKDSCIVMKETIDCKTKNSFNIPNCSQCLTSGEWNRVDPKSVKIAPSFFLQGVANSVNIQTANAGTTSVSITNTTSTLVNIPSPGISEGESFIISVRGEPGTCFIAGYLTGQTPRGEFSMDINAFIDIDMTTNYKPRISGTQLVGNVMCMAISPASGSGTMTLRVHLPFSFIGPTESDAIQCDNGPFITKAESATFLASSPCYAKGNVPGKYSIQCLQQLFTQLGGTINGSGYPRDQATVNALLVSTDGNPRDLDDITSFLDDITTRASTGRDAAGNTLSVDDWNTASVFCTGVQITNPCGVGNPADRASQDCMTYLYQNKGITNDIGATYTLSGQYASLNAIDNQTFCRDSGTLNPVTNTGFTATSQLASTIGGVKILYNTVHKTANDNGLTNQQRAVALGQCYGTAIQQQHIPEPYFIGGGTGWPAWYSLSKSQASDACKGFGATLASTIQVQDAQQKYGADWCAAGWVADGDSVFPTTTQLTSSCGGTTPGVRHYVPPNNLAGAVCFGTKPPPGTVQSGMTVQPFSKATWYMDQNTSVGSS